MRVWRDGENNSGLAESWTVEGCLHKREVVEVESYRILQWNTPEEENENFVRICSRDRNPYFKFSKGWFENFLKRRSLSLRRVSSCGRDLLGDTIPRINLFYSEVGTL